MSLPVLPNAIFPYLSTKNPHDNMLTIANIQGEHIVAFLLYFNFAIFSPKEMFTWIYLKAPGVYGKRTNLPLQQI